MESPSPVDDSPQQTGGGQQSVKLFVGGLTGDMTKDTLAEYFSRFAEVVDSFVVYERHKPAGFGFITTKNAKDAETILNATHTLNNSILDVKPALDRIQARDKEESDRRRKVFVGGLPKNFPDEQLKVFFEKYGPVQKSYVVKDPMTGKTRGFGFVIFSTDEGYYKSLENPNLIIGGSEAHVKPATAKQDEKIPKGTEKSSPSPIVKKSKKTKQSIQEVKPSQNTSQASPKYKEMGASITLQNSHIVGRDEDVWESPRVPVQPQAGYHSHHPHYYSSSPINMASPAGYHPHPKGGYYGPQFQYPVQMAPVYYPPPPPPTQAIGHPVQSLNRIQLYSLSSRQIYYDPLSSRPTMGKPGQFRNLQSTKAILHKPPIGSFRMQHQGPFSTAHQNLAPRSAHTIPIHPRTFSTYEVDRSKMSPRQPPLYEESPFSPQDEEDDDFQQNDLSRARDF